MVQGSGFRVQGLGFRALTSLRSTQTHWAGMGPFEILLFVFEISEKN